MSSPTSASAIAAATPPVLAKSYSGEERVPECTSPSSSPSSRAAVLSPSKIKSVGAGNHVKHMVDERVVESASSNQDAETSSATCLKDTLKRVQANDEAITELDLTEMADKYSLKLKSSGGTLVARVMEMNHTVGRLVLPDHAIGDAGALAMADMLRMNSTIRELDLCGNGISDVGCKGIADALYGHDSLHHLALWSNAIGDEGAKALAQALQVNRSLTFVGLVGNNIGEDGAKALLEAVQMNPMIQTLGLAANPIPHELQHELHVALAVNKAAAMTMTTEAVAAADTDANDGDEETGSSLLAPVVDAMAAAMGLPNNNNGEEHETAIMEYDSNASSGDDESDSETDDEAHVAEQAEEDDDDDEFWV
ncbi:hypothetical protein Gpo141_00004098 [Globisporangium polare]